MAEKSKIVMVTGFPEGFLAKRLVKKILAEEPATQLRCVVPNELLTAAEAAMASWPQSARARATLLEGDVAAMDMGLSGREYRRLASELNVLHHCDALSFWGADPKTAAERNVGGTREAVELALEAEHLERLVHWSTASVSGSRPGVVGEEELTGGGARNVIEQTRFQAETVVRRAKARVATTVLRPSIIVGDSKTGEIERFDGPYLLILLLLNAPTDLRIPLPARAEIPLNLVPVDFVVDAGYAICTDPRSIGRTFHLVDPEPPSVRQVFEWVAQEVGRPVPRGSVPTQFAAALLRAPGLERFAHVPRAFLEQLATEVTYDDRQARELLDARGIHCPRFETYVGTLVDFVRAQHERRRTNPPRPAAEP